MWQSLLDSINSTELTTANAVFRLVVSMLLGACIGVERKRRGQMAGMRTFALIAMGATLAMLLSIYVPQQYLGLKNGDPGRIAAQVISGIGFLGAGAIIQMKGSVRGLTTAAGIWLVAIVGMAVGVGMYWVSLISTALVLFVLTLLERIEHSINVGAAARTIMLRYNGIIDDIEPFREILKRNGATLNKYFLECNYQDNTTRISLIVLARGKTSPVSLLSDLRRHESLLSASFVNTPS